MEGKETRFGIAASNGSVNSMHDSYTPLAGMVTMLLMQLGEVIFGGVGCGFYGMLAFVILTVFIAGFNANTVFLNVSLGLMMLFARFLPIIGTLAIAGSLAGKKKIAKTAGTLSTTNGMFVFLLIVVVLLIGALSFFPALALGPLAEFFGSIA